jgi:PLD-like domain
LNLQDNNCLTLNSSQLAAIYKGVFEDLLNRDHPHTKEGGSNASAAVKVGNMNITPFYSPSRGEDIENAVVSKLNDAKRVRVLSFLVSDPGVLKALSRFKEDSTLDILGVYDPNGMNDATRRTSQDPSRFWFRDDNRFVAAPSHPFNQHGGENDFMHNKVLIVDDDTVITGSYNFSENAELNDENVLVMNSPDLAAAYTGYFDALYSQYGGKARK